MDFGGLDDILDDDIGYIPTAIKRDLKPRQRPTNMSRQNSTKSIGSVKDQKDEKQVDSLFGLERSSHNDQPMKNSQQFTPHSSRRNTLFGLHKQTAQQGTHNLNQSPMSFEDFFKTQSNPTQNIQSLSKPPLPEPKNTTERRLEKNSSFSQLGSPQNILEDELNNSSVASRRGRPPLSRRSQNVVNEVQVGNNNNKSENFAASNAFVVPNNIEAVTKSPQLNKNTFNTEKSQQQPPIPNSQSYQPLTSPQPSPPHQSIAFSSFIPDKSIQQLKTLFSNQLDYQKQMFQTLIKQERDSHQGQIKKLRQIHNDEIRKKVELKDFEIQKMRQFYELQLKIQNQRQSEVKQYSSIARKLQGNIEIIQKLERNIKQNSSKERIQKQEFRLGTLQKKQSELKMKQADLRSLQTKLQQQAASLKSQKQQLLQQLSSQRNRIYQLQIQLRSKQSQLQITHKKLQHRLTQQYEYKSRLIEKEKQDLRIESLQLHEQRKLIELEKLEVVNLRKQWESERKAQLENLHHEKTKVMEKEIQMVARVGQLEVKEQEVKMSQDDYVNKLKLVDLERKRLQVQKKASKGQVCFNITSQSPSRMRANGGMFGTTAFMNKTSQSALNKQFYSNGDNTFQPFQAQSTSNYKKSITQMRDEFLKSLPKF